MTLTWSPPDADGSCLPIQDDPWRGISDAAKLVGVPASTVRELIQARAIRFRVVRSYEAAQITESYAINVVSLQTRVDLLRFLQHSSTD